MPAKGTRKTAPLRHRLSTNVDAKLQQTFLSRAAAAGMSDAHYLRHLIEADAGINAATPLIRRRNLKRQQLDTLAHEVNMVGVQLRKVGVNLNQLAKQANAGMVPISRQEAVTVMTELQLIMTLARAALERSLA
jgi:hypothetical protein